MSVNTGDSWSTQYFRVEGKAESSPAALQTFCLLNSLLISLSKMERIIVVVGEEGASEINVVE